VISKARAASASPIIYEFKEVNDDLRRVQQADEEETAVRIIGARFTDGA